MREKEEDYARPRVIRGTQVKPLPLLPSGPGGVCSRPLHEARSLTSYGNSLGTYNPSVSRAFAHVPCAVTVCSPHPPSEILEQARQKLLRVTRSLPKYPGVETVDREYFDAPAPV